MRHAIALSSLGLGTTSPNPPVGCVLLDPAGEPVGQGGIAARANRTPRRTRCPRPVPAAVDQQQRGLSRHHRTAFTNHSATVVGRKSRDR